MLGKIRSLLRLVTIALTVLVTLEICAHLDDTLTYGAPFLGNYSIDSIFAFGPNGKHGVPNARFKRWQLDSNGFRNPEPVPGRPRILVIGASESFGISEPSGMEYPAQLQRVLSERGLDFSVINAAIPGMRHGYVEYLRDALERVRPAYVLFYPSPANYIGRTAPLCGAQRTWPVGGAESKRPQSRVLPRVWDVFKASAPAPLMEGIRRFQIRLALNGEALPRVPDATIAAYRSDLECALDAVERAGARPLILGHATRFGPGLTAAEPLEMLTWRTFYPELSERGFTDLEARANAAAAEVATAREIPFSDLSTRVPPGPRYFSDFVHFTGEGAALVARAGAELIEANERGR